MSFVLVNFGSQLFCKYFCLVHKEYDVCTVQEKVCDNLFFTVCQKLCFSSDWYVTCLLRVISVSPPPLCYILHLEKAKKYYTNSLVPLTLSRKQKSYQHVKNFFVKREEEVFVIPLQWCHISRAVFICWMCAPKKCKPRHESSEGNPGLLSIQ